MLTDKHIDYLYLVCEEHGVRYYDLQTEIVDHLAAVIESELEKDPSKNFFKAVDETVASFGKNCLTKIADAEKIAISKAFYIKYNGLLKKYFSLPYILGGVVLLIILIYPFIQKIFPIKVCCCFGMVLVFLLRE